MVLQIVNIWGETPQLKFPPYIVDVFRAFYVSKYMNGSITISPELGAGSQPERRPSS